MLLIFSRFLTSRDKKKGGKFCIQESTRVTYLIIIVNNFNTKLSKHVLSFLKIYYKHTTFSKVDDVKFSCDLCLFHTNQMNH